MFRYRPLVGAAAFFALTAGAPALAQDDITIGFVTHAQGNPFIQQIVDGAQAAADDLGVTLQVAQNAGGDPEGQLQHVQNFVNAGAQGVATSVPGESMAKGLNDIIASGVPIVQYNLLSTAVNAPYVGEKSTQSGRILGKAIVDKLGGASATGTVIIGNCFPGFPVLENRAKGVQESLGGGFRPERARTVRREGQRGRQLQSLGAALRRQSGCRRAGRPLRARRCEPRQAECRERRQVRRPAATT